MYVNVTFELWSLLHSNFGTRLILLIGSKSPECVSTQGPDSAYECEPASKPSPNENKNAGYYLDQGNSSNGKLSEVQARRIRFMDSLIRIQKDLENGRA